MRKLLLVLLLGALFLVACEKELTIVGSWHDETAGMSITFSEDGKGSFSQVGGVASFEYLIEDDKLIMTINGKEDHMNYKIEGEELELSYPDLDDYELTFTRVHLD